MNNINLLGRITKDLELKNSTSGTAWLPFTVAVKRKRSTETDFIPVTAFGKTAETIANHFQKGHRIGLTGRLEITSKKKNGKWETYTNVVIEDFDFVESKYEFERTPYESSAVETPEQRIEMKKEETIDVTAELLKTNPYDYQLANRMKKEEEHINPFTLEQELAGEIEPTQEEAIQKMMDFGEHESEGTMMQQFREFERQMGLRTGDKQ